MEDLGVIIVKILGVQPDGLSGHAPESYLSAHGLQLQCCKIWQFSTLDLKFVAYLSCQRY
uniref:Uncharacterized protein n=1 Tax=Rhizophora mucronata TaxID=61149 RepID=A0A2P2QU11_RHIMU